MLFGSQDPQEGKKADHWDHEQLKEKNPVSGWKAGEPVWIHRHWVYRSIPCYHELTDGRLSCPYDKDYPNLVRQGYLPIYRDDQSPAIAVIYDDMEHIVKQIGLHKPLVLSRAKQRGAAISVRPSLKGRDWIRPPAWRAPPDITPVLLVWWKELALFRFFGIDPPKKMQAMLAAGDHEHPYVPPLDPDLASDPTYLRQRAELQALVDAKRKRGEPIGMADLLPHMNGRAHRAKRSDEE